MEGFQSILKLIADGKLKEAETLLGENKERDGDYWYLGGLLAFFKGNKELSLNFFMKTLELNAGEKTKEYAKRHAAYILFSQGRFEKAIELLEKVKEKTIRDNFVLFVSYVMVGNSEKGGEYFKKCYLIDKARTRELLIEFYNQYVKGNPAVGEEERKEFLSLIEGMENN